MPDLHFKCIWWAVVVLLLLTGHCSIDAGMYLLYMALEEFCDACNLVNMYSSFFIRCWNS